MVELVDSSVCRISITWLRVTASPCQIILSLAWLELQPMIRASLIILSIEFSGYLQTLTRLWMYVSQELRVLSPCLLRVHNSKIESSLLPLGLNSSSRRFQYV